jgi:hypothetical protein
MLKWLKCLKCPNICTWIYGKIGKKNPDRNNDKYMEKVERLIHHFYWDPIQHFFYKCALVYLKAEVTSKGLQS